MDTISDLLVRIKSALAVRKEAVDVPHSRVSEEIVRLLLTEGYVGKYENFSRMNKKFLRIALKYNGAKQSVISGMKRVSTPGRRIYVAADGIRQVQAGFGTAIISTSKGIMTDEAARHNKIGGEVLCNIW